MAVVALTSAAGSPGVSTSVVGLSLAWHRPCLVVEADPTGASALLTGYMRQYAAGGIVSVFDIAVRLRQSGQMPNLMEAAAKVPNTNIRLLSGIRSHNQAQSMTEAWPQILQKLRLLDAAGIDVIIDVGRLGLIGSPTTLVTGADLVLLTTRSTLPAVVAANSWAPTLISDVGTDTGHLGLLLIGEGRPYKAPEISDQLHIPVVATLPSDPTTAEVFSLGATAGRRFDRSPLYRSLPPAVAAIRQHMTNTKAMLRGDIP